MHELARCPREGCRNLLAGPGQVVCGPDITILASMCRGKKRVGEPEAEWIASRHSSTDAYHCELCRQWHNGARVRRRMELIVVVRATLAALRADDRVGWRGVLLLADAWSPGNVNRSRWHEGIDQRVAMPARWV